MTTRELLETYYRGLANKKGWDSVLAEDFQFVGGDMTRTEPIIGLDSYRQILSRFSSLFTGFQIQTMLPENGQAFVLVTYDYVFPNGKKFSGKVAEYWTIQKDRLQSLTIFFDTLNFAAFTKP